MAAIAYWILQRSIIAVAGTATRLLPGGGRRLEGQHLARALRHPALWSSLRQRCCCSDLAVVAVMWLVPDRRIEPRDAEVTSGLSGRHLYLGIDPAQYRARRTTAASRYART